MASEEAEQSRGFLYPYLRGKEMPWQKVIVPNYVIPFIRLKENQGSKPTVRGALYHLETMRVLPKNAHTYERLVRALSNARRGYKRADGTRGPPTIAMDAFADNTRQIIKDFDDEERSLEDYINDGIKHFRYMPNGFKTLVPRWLDQPNYVEVFVEKNSMAQNVKLALKGRHVVIAPNGGNSSITFMHNNIERLIDQFLNENRQKVWILYLGDLDPNGWDMDRQIKEDLSRQTKDLTDKDGNAAAPRFAFRRIGITKKQIEKFKLTHLMHPDRETMAKFEKHPKIAAAFKKEFGSLFQVELEAFDLISFTEFQKLISGEIDKYFNKGIYEQVLARPEYSQEPDKIKDQIVNALIELVEELKSKD